MAVISQLLLNPERLCFWFWSQLNYHRLFNIYSSQIQDGDIQDGDIQDGVPFVYCVQAPLCFRILIGPATILKGNIEHFRFTTRQPPRIQCRCGRRHPHVCELATERLVH